MSTSHELQEGLRVVRGRYDELKRGETAPLRRCRTASEVALESAYWRVGGTLAHSEVHLAHVVLLFPLALQAGTSSRAFSFGRFLRGHLGESSGAMLRFRRLIASGDRDELDHRLRGMLRLACADKAPLDWTILGRDILWFFAESDHVRRRWAQDFYAPMPGGEPGGATTTITATLSANAQERS